MDPNTNLERARLIASTMREISDADDEDRAGEYVELADELAELVQAMDDWLSNGGYLPTSWKS